jgi:hypothetical protein
MGMVIMGKRIYTTSFLGLGATGHGEVLSLPLSGGKIRPLVTGTIAPVVGLGAHAGWLYFGEVDAGLVYRVKP